MPARRGAERNVGFCIDDAHDPCVPFARKGQRHALTAARAFPYESARSEERLRSGTSETSPLKA